MPNDKSQFHVLKQKLEKRHKEIKEKLIADHGQSFHWLTNNVRQIGAGAMGGMLLLTAPTMQLIGDGQAKAHQEQFIDVPDNVFLVNDLKQYVPEEVGKLSGSQEQKIAEVLSGYFGMTVAPSLNGMRLQDTYGYIGAEQHLMRYPGDTIDSHFESSEEAMQFGRSGMAPGRGAYGYFAPSRAEMTQRDIDEEKYYIAVQTFLADDYNTRTKDYVNFFKYRKMLVVNPNTGRAIVVVIGDAGPAVWTKKQLGGSPEVMRHLERVDGKAKGSVLYFFIDDPEDKIPLGPINP